MGEINRHFSQEFKRDAVQLITEKGMAVRKVARELDIHPNLLHIWKRTFLAQGIRPLQEKAESSQSKQR